MFDILQEIFDSDLVFYTALLAVSSFLLAEFKVKKLNTKLIVCAVLMIIYVISSIIYNFVAPWSNAYGIFFLVGGFAISVFVGFAIDTVFRLTKKKSLIIIFSVVLALIIGLLVWWNVPKSLCEIDAQKVEKITIYKTWFNEEIEVTDEQTIENLIEKFNSITMENCRYGPNTMGFVFEVTIETENDQQKFTVGVYGVRSAIFNYQVIEGDTGFYYINDMFQKFYD